MSSPPTGTKKRILDTALRMIQEKSYNAFSLSELAERTDIKKASIYYHFPSKEDLISKTMKHYHDKVVYLTKKLNTMTDDSWERLDNYFKFFENFVDQELICPGTIIGSEFNAVPEEVNIELNSLFDYYIEWLSEVLEFGAQKGELVLNDPPRDAAIHFASAIAGATILTRSHKNKEYFETTRDVLLKSVSPDGQIRHTEDLINQIQV